MKDDSIKKISNNLLESIFEVMLYNEAFLMNNVKEIYTEIIEFINQAIDFVIVVNKKENSIERYSRYSMFYFFNHILMPFSYAIYIDVLIGNIPICFIELRLILESYVKCYMADLTFPEINFFQDKLNLIEKYLNEQRVSISSLIKQFEKKVGLINEFITLWGKISFSWVHSKGIMNGIIKRIIEKSDVPPWSLILPMPYTNNDLEALEGLRKAISQFSDLLSKSIKNYKENVCSFT